MSVENSLNYSFTCVTDKDLSLHALIVLKSLLIALYSL